MSFHEGWGLPLKQFIPKCLVILKKASPLNHLNSRACEDYTVEQRTIDTNIEQRTVSFDSTKKTKKKNLSKSV